ncbi:MAG: GDP-mannose 4,6-dehydratase [Alphaproteobacteria bacterium]|nr:GDP-mannose 4,6-dehydratase [Alphaproteobacteria bacterium]
MRKTALITGIAGQDGSYLSAFLLAKGYRVHGLVRWDNRNDPLDAFEPDVVLHNGDLTDANALSMLLKRVQPDEIYNLAALSHVKVSFETPASALAINAGGTLNLLESIRVLGMEKSVRFYQASSSEMFGGSPAPQNEDTPMQPCSPYGAAKLSAYWLARTYRESYGLHVSNGILFNHESPLRSVDFVTRKITKAVAEMEKGRLEPLVLGNLEAVRDWGYAQDYVEGMYQMLQREKPDDYVLATGKAHSVRDFVVRAFSQIGLGLVWHGEGLGEEGRDARTGRVLVKVDATFFRPSEVHVLRGDAAKARRLLGWQPRTSFDDLVALMVNADREALRTGYEDRAWMQAG